MTNPGKPSDRSGKNRPTIDDLSEIFFQVADAPKERQSDLLIELCPDQNLRRKIREMLEADSAGDELLDHTLFPKPIEVQAGETIAGYRLVSEIAHGGMGVVFLAHQTEPVRRAVALKVIKPGVDTREVIARFDVERQALSLMNHPSIAKVFDAGSTDAGRPFFVMELVDGQPITTYCEQNQLSATERLELFIPVCRAIQHAHQKGVIHRDIKPSNILVAEYDGRPVAKVIDFGVAKAIDQSLSEITIATGLGQIIGTFDYMSPEQSRVNQRDVDTRSDIYSLGVVLYELLTDSPPFDRERLRSADLEEMLKVIREEDPPRPSERLADIRKIRSEETPTRLNETQASADYRTEKENTPETKRTQSNSQLSKLSRVVKGELDWIVMKAMDKDRNRRYTTPSELAADIERFLRGEAVSACPPSAVYRFRKFARRNKVAFATSGLVACSLILGLIGTSYQWLRASRAESATQAANDFLVEDLLGLAVPNSQRNIGQGPVPNLTLLMLLTNASKRVDERFPDQPDVQAKLKATLANLFNSIGKYEDAERLYEEYLRFLRSTKGPGDADTIRVMRHLVRIEIDKERPRLAHAERLGDEALRNSRHYLGEQHEVTLLLLNDMATLYHKRELPQKAIDTYLQCLEIRRHLFGEKHASTLMTMSNLASAYETLDRLDDAQELHEQVVDSYREFLSPNDVRLAGALHNLAKCYLKQGQASKADSHFEYAADLLKECEQIVKDARWSAHPISLDIKNSLAQVYIQQGDFKRAFPLLQDVVSRLERQKESEQRPSLGYLEAVNLLGWTHMRLSRFSEAENVLTEAYEILGEVDEIDGAEFLRTEVMGNLAIVRYRMGKIQDAVSMDEQTLKLVTEQLSENHIAVLSVKTRLGLGYLESGKVAAGRDYLEQVFNADPEHSDSHKIAGLLSSSYLDIESEAGPENEAFQQACQWTAKQIECGRRLLANDTQQFCDLLHECGTRYIRIRAFSEADKVLSECMRIQSNHDHDESGKTKTRMLIEVLNARRTSE